MKMFRHEYEKYAKRTLVCGTIAGTIIGLIGCAFWMKCLKNEELANEIRIHRFDKLFKD